MIKFTILLSINIVVIICYMGINSFVCPSSYSGGECVKRLDLFCFYTQVALNILFSIYALVKGDKFFFWWSLLSLVTTSVVFYVAAIIHSISKVGLWT